MEIIEFSNIVAVVRKDTLFKDCNYTQPPYRYYADALNFNTQIGILHCFSFASHFFFFQFF